MSKRPPEYEHNEYLIPALSRLSAHTRVSVPPTALCLPAIESMQRYPLQTADYCRLWGYICWLVKAKTKKRGLYGYERDVVLLDDIRHGLLAFLLYNHHKGTVWFEKALALRWSAFARTAIRKRLGMEYYWRDSPGEDLIRPLEVSLWERDGD